MKKYLCVAVVAACGALGNVGPLVANPEDTMMPKWSSYRDPNSGVTAELPWNIFTVDAGSPSAGRGREYATPDRRALVAFFGLSNDGAEKSGGYLG